METLAQTIAAGAAHQLEQAQMARLPQMQPAHLRQPVAAMAEMAEPPALEPGLPDHPPAAEAAERIT